MRNYFLLLPLILFVGCGRYLPEAEKEIKHVNEILGTYSFTYTSESKKAFELSDVNDVPVGAVLLLGLKAIDDQVMEYIKRDDVLLRERVLPYRLYEGVFVHQANKGFFTCLLVTRFHGEVRYMGLNKRDDLMISHAYGLGLFLIFPIAGRPAPIGITCKRL